VKSRADAVLKGVEALRKLRPNMRVEIHPASDRPLIVTLDGWVSISEAEIEVVRSSILGDEVVKVQGFLLEKAVMSYGAYSEPDDVDIVAVGEYENVLPVVRDAYMEIVENELSQCLEYVWYEESFVDVSEE